MKSFYTLIILSFFTINIALAQNYQTGSITTKDQQSVEGRVAIDNSSKKVFFKKNGESNVYSFSNIEKVEIVGTNYSKIKFNNEELLANSLTTGKATLYSLSNDDILIIKENNDGHQFNLKNDKAQIPGLLSLFFNDCNSLREVINKTDYFTEKSLKSLTDTYNNCEFGAYTPSENEISKASAYNTDYFRFYGGLLSTFNKTTVNDFDPTNTSGFGIGVGLASSPAFMGNLKGNLYFNFDVNMLFNGSQDFKNGSTPLNYKLNTYRFSIGMEYVFNKNGNVQPFIGIGYAFSLDHYDGELGTISFKDDSRKFFFTPKAGVLFQLNNENHIGLTVSYIPKYESDLSFYFNEELNPLVIDTESITIGVNYYF